MVNPRDIAGERRRRRRRPMNVYSDYVDSLFSYRSQATFTCNIKAFIQTIYLQIKMTARGRNSSDGSAWARCPQRRGFDPPLGKFFGRGDFSLGGNMGSNSIPPKTLSDESINRDLVCAFHRMDSKDPDVHVLDG